MEVNKNIMRKEDKIYESKYGMIPDSQTERLNYILGKKASNVEFNNNVMMIAKKMQKLKMIRLKFTMWKVVKPSARPRFSHRGTYINTYVPGAAEAGDWFAQFAKENDLPVIDTPCILNMNVYEKTPSSFNMTEKVLAELGFIRPWKRTGDFDNYAKAIADCIQHGMLKDDCLVIESTQKLFYSIKPHADIEILYYIEHPMSIVEKYKQAEMKSKARKALKNKRKKGR